MKTTWKVIGRATLILVALGFICILVGIFTGGSLSRIESTLNANYDVDAYIGIGKTFYSYVEQGVKWIIAQVGAWF